VNDAVSIPLKGGSNLTGSFLSEPAARLDAQAGPGRQYFLLSLLDLFPYIQLITKTVVLKLVHVFAFYNRAPSHI
jgi:hypothetical protein